MAELSRLHGILIISVTRTKYDRLDGMNNRRLFLTVSEAGKSKIKAPGDLAPGEGPPGDGQLFAVSSLGRESMLVSYLPTRTLVPMLGGLPS